MATISRKEQERIRVGEDIIVTVTRIRGNRVTLNVQAPKDLPIVREEPETTEERSKDALRDAELNT